MFLEFEGEPGRFIFPRRSVCVLFSVSGRSSARLSESSRKYPDHVAYLKRKQAFKWLLIIKIV